VTKLGVRIIYSGSRSPTLAAADLAPPRVYAGGFIQFVVLRKRGLGEKRQAAEHLVGPHFRRKNN